MPEQNPSLSLTPSESEPHPRRPFTARLPWTLAGLALALLVVLVLPSAQINLGAKTLQGLVGTYTDPPAGDHWDITYAYNGSNTVTRPGADGQPHTDTYLWTAAGVPNQEEYISYAGSLSMTSSGTITATLTWVSPAGNAPPPSIKVMRRAGASWGHDNGSGGNGSGSASDGLGDDYVDSGNGGGGHSDSGSDPHFVDKDSTSGVVTVDDTISASASDTPLPSYFGGGYYSTSLSFFVAVHAQPYDFKDAGHYDAFGWLPGPIIDNTNGVLIFHYDWKSTSGDKADLIACTIYENTSYDGNTVGTTGIDPTTGKPTYSPPQPPFLTWILFNPENGESTRGDATGPNGRLGAITDTQGHGSFVRDAHLEGYPESSFFSTQKFVFDDSITHEVGTPLAGPWAITRTVQPTGPPSQYAGQYTVSKSGYTATDQKDLP